MNENLLLMAVAFPPLIPLYMMIRYSETKKFGFVFIASVMGPVLSFFAGSMFTGATELFMAGGALLSAVYVLDIFRSMEDRMKKWMTWLIYLIVVGWCYVLVGITSSAVAL